MRYRAEVRHAAIPASEYGAKMGAHFTGMASAVVDSPMVGEMLKSIEIYLRHKKTRRDGNHSGVYWRKSAT